MIASLKSKCDQSLNSLLQWITIIAVYLFKISSVFIHLIQSVLFYAFELGFFHFYFTHSVSCVVVVVVFLDHHDECTRFSWQLIFWYNIDGLPNLNNFEFTDDVHHADFNQNTHVCSFQTKSVRISLLFAFSWRTKRKQNKKTMWANSFDSPHYSASALLRMVNYDDEF